MENEPAQEATNLEKEIALLEQRAATEWLEERQKRKDCAGVRGLGAFDRSTIYRLREAYAEREAKGAAGGRIIGGLFKCSANGPKKARPCVGSSGSSDVWAMS